MVTLLINTGGLMRRALLTILVLSTCAAALPASALEADETMQAWKHASAADRAALLKKLGADGVTQCMDETSAAPGHSDLPIAEVAKACASKGGQPV